MKKSKLISLNFEIDKLTNSIENVVTGEVFQTTIAPTTILNLKFVTKKNGWLFDWKLEHKMPERNVYKLSIRDNPDIIQGLMSVEVKADHVYMHLVENAPFNRGQRQMYAGVPGNLVAFACKLSLELGFEGAVSFQSKSNLVSHYQKTLGAVHIARNVMVIESQAAKQLIARYFRA